MPRMTTTKSGFRVEDVTFKGARKQSAIIEELGLEESVMSEGDVQVPVSLTPEQVKSFFSAKIDATYNGNEKNLYRQTIKWIDELFETKKKLVSVEEKLATYQKVEDEIPEELKL